jgi:hypothetical protein
VAAGSLVDESVRALSGYYGRLGRIGLDLARLLVPIEQLRDAVDRLPIEATPLAGVARRAAASVASGASVAPKASTGDAASFQEPPETPSILVEADGDRPGFGVFLVENLTAEPVAAPISVSVFVDDEGRTVRPRLVLRPATIRLAPGEQAMVRVAADLDDAFELGVRYRGEIAIPALSDRRIPIVLRRRPIEPEPVDATAEASKAGTAGSPAAAPGKAAAAKTVASARSRGRKAAPSKGAPSARAPGAGPAVRPAAKPPRRRSAASPDEPR